MVVHGLDVWLSINDPDTPVEVGKDPKWANQEKLQIVCECRFSALNVVSNELAYPRKYE